MKFKYITGIKSNLQIFTNKYSTNVLEGRYRSIYRGKSLNFDSLRAYDFNDDIKDIDWKSSARSNNILVKQYIAEKKHNIMFIIDTGEKMDGVSRSHIRKLDIALNIVGTLGYLGVNNGDYISALIEKDGKLSTRPFKYNLESLEEMLTIYEKVGTNNNKISLSEKIKHLYHVLKKKMIIFIITDSDGLEDLDEKILKELTHRHDVMIITIPDAYMYGNNLVDLDSKKSIVSFFAKNTEIHNAEIKIRQEQDANNIKKMKRNQIDTISIENIESIPESIISLLERHRYGGSKRK